ncbi:acyltransferase family protein [Micrococcus luteus]|uniref:acyltransferase family protein n=1 Tax=Micrococcus luteus TaxID=1270 RepID=UPI00191014D3|nr:acyltransferase [Micrococcus luteus]QQE49786.1 acyltransferase [Micrococcus luteus]
MDALRLVSIAAVVLGHAYLTDLTFSRYLEVWRMPLFFFLTGYFWTRGRPWAEDARNRFRSLMVPYLVWAVLMSVAAFVWFADDPDLLRRLMLSGWYGGADQEPPWWAFWFISVLFFATVLRRFLERFPSVVAWAVGLAGLAWAHLMPDSAIARTPLGIGLALPCLLFILSGEMFRRHVQPRVRRHRTLIGVGLVLLGLAAVRLGLEPPNIKFGGFGTPLLTPAVGVLMSAGMVLVFGSTVEGLLRAFARRTGTGEALRRAITALVRTGTVVVLLHGGVLLWIMRLGVEDNGAKFALALGLSWLTGLALLATPVSQAFTGAPRRWYPLHRVRGLEPPSSITSAPPRATTASERKHP